MIAEITDDLIHDLADLRFGPPVHTVYNPLIYARPVWDLYCERFGRGRREVVLVGMNPGPWGMAQVGVPFGEIRAVRSWLGLHGTVGRPEVEHPKRPVRGFDCPRSEVSGRRFWGWAAETFGTPEAFFERFFVANYCPLAFMEESGRNRVPERLRVAECRPLFAACDRALRRTVLTFRPRFVVGVGKFAEDRARAAAGDLGAVVGRIPHPSPASPLANRGWAAQATRALRDLGVDCP